MGLDGPLWEERNGQEGLDACPPWVQIGLGEGGSAPLSFPSPSSFLLPPLP